MGFQRIYGFQYHLYLVSAVLSLFLLFFHFSSPNYVTPPPLFSPKPAFLPGRYVLAPSVCFRTLDARLSYFMDILLHFSHFSLTDFLAKDGLILRVTEARILYALFFALMLYGQAF